MTTDTEQNDGAATNEAEGTPKAETQVVEGKTGTEGESTTEGTGTKPAADEELKFEVPEGVELNEADMTSFKDVLKDKTLTDAQRAQKLLDIAVSREQARSEAFAKQVSDWADQVKADKELGTPENLATAKNVIDTFGDDEIRGLLNSSGMGNHPAVVRLMLKIGKAISEDTFVRGKAAPEGATKSDADIIYGSST